MVEFPMSDDVGALAERFPAVGTHVGLLPSVNSPVLGEG